MNSSELKVVYYDGKTQVYIEDMITSVSWSGDMKQAFRKLEVSLVNIITNGERKRRYTFQNGKQIRLYWNGEELFRGVVFSNDIDDKGNQSLTAYDENIYLTKNSAVKIATNVKASTLIKSLCADKGIPVGTITDTGYVIKKFSEVDKTLWDIMTRALAFTHKGTGKKYHIYSRFGKLYVVPRTVNPVRVALEQGRNLISASKREDIEDIKNSIKIRSGDPEDKKKVLYASAKDQTSINLYGLMEETSVESDLKQGEMDAEAKKILKEKNKPAIDIDLSSVGNSSVVSGKGIYVYENVTGLSGGYYVTQDTHKWDASGNYTMDVTVSKTDETFYDDIELSNEEWNESRGITKPAPKPAPKKKTSEPKPDRSINW